MSTIISSEKMNAINAATDLVRIQESLVDTSKKLLDSIKKHDPPYNKVAVQNAQIVYNNSNIALSDAKNQLSILMKSKILQI